MANDCGGCFHNNFAVRPGKFVRYPFLRASSNVESVGENSVACANPMSSAGMAEPIVARVVSVISLGDVGSACVGMVNCHNRVMGVRKPVRTIWFA